MFVNPNETLKPFLWMAWIGITAFSLVGVLFGSLSLLKAGVIAVAGAFLLFLLSTGFFSYLFHINVTTKLTIQLKGIFITFASSYVYPVIYLSFFLAEYSNKENYTFHLILFSVLSFFWLLILYRRVRLIEDTPSTRLNSAAQGYAELEGVVTLYDGEVVRGPSQDLPVMVWYRKYFLTSSAGFILDDGKGRCTIDPRDAEVITPLHHYIGILYRAIYPNETIYALGYLQTLSKQRTEEERNTLVRHTLVSWKRNQFKFLNYFDKNNDGKIDASEMQVAKQAAERKVGNDLEEVYLEPATHTISTPTDGRPFILSSIHPDDLIVRYKRAMIFHVIAWIVFALFSLIL